MFAAILDQLKQGKISYEETREVLISTLNSSPEMHTDVTTAINTAKNSPLTQAQQQELIGLVNDITEQTGDTKTRILPSRVPSSIGNIDSRHDSENDSSNNAGSDTVNNNGDETGEETGDESTIIKPHSRKNSSDQSITDHITSLADSKENITATEVLTEVAITAMQKTQVAEAPATLPPQNLVAGQLKPGDTLKGRFVLEELVGQGGMGMVFKARDLRKEEAMDSNPYVAVKVLGGSFKDHPQALISLQRESRKAQTLAHPNIVTVYDFDRDGDTAYMTMEYLEGDSLDRVIKKQYPEPFSKEQALLIIEGICNGLAYAHSHNIIHADLKPGNVYVTKNNIVKIFDFGIARAMTSQEGEQKVDSLTGETTLFDAGDLGGITPAYASFEMLTGQDPDIRDDIYALACIAYELLAGKHPFNKLPANQASERQLSPPAVPHISRKQFHGLERGLSFERERRTPSVPVFQDDLCRNKTFSKTLLLSITIAIVVLIYVATIPLGNYFDNQKIAEVVEKLKSGNEQTVLATLKDIENLETNIGKSALENGKDAVIKYYEQKALFHTDNANGRYNFDTANRELNKAEKLYKDSAKLKEIRSRIDGKKDELLSNLTQRFNTHIDSENLISDPSADDLVETLAQIAQIESSHPLLRDERISYAYAQAAEKAASRKGFSRAQQLVITGLVLLPQDSSLINIKKAIEAANADGGSKKSKLASFKLSLEKSITPMQRKLSIESLLKKPFKNKQWQKTLTTQLTLLKQKVPESDPWLKQNFKLIERIYVSHAKTLREANKFTSAKRILANAKKLISTTKSIKKEEKNIKVAKKRFKITQAAEAKANRIKTIKKTILSQSRANNVKAANENLRKLKKLVPAKDNFLSFEAPKAISDAYLKLAQNSARRGDYNAAINLVKSGLNLSPKHSLLKTSLKNYQSRLPTSSKSSAKKSSDPCRSKFAGHGKRSRATCHDKLGKQKGPTMIVIPAGPSISKAYAISKYEISIADYNIYCQSSKQCKTRPGAADLPISGISISDAKKYSRWLIKTSGYTYRIPTDIEWLHAAKAGGKQPAKDFNCQVSLGGNLIKGISLVNTRSGKSNGWGLINYIGNVQEWVLKNNTSLHARGGSFKNSLSTCDLNYSRPHNGNPDKITGLRLVRELK